MCLNIHAQRAALSRPLLANPLICDVAQIHVTQVRRRAGRAVVHAPGRCGTSMISRRWAKSSPGIKMPVGSAGATADGCARDVDGASTRTADDARPRTTPRPRSRRRDLPHRTRTLPRLTRSNHTQLARGLHHDVGAAHRHPPQLIDSTHRRPARAHTARALPVHTHADMHRPRA